MWIYPSSPETVQVQNQREILLPTESPMISQPAERSLKNEERNSKNEKRPPSASKRLISDSKPTGNHWLLVVAFLIGTAMAGILRVRLDLVENDILTYYLEKWSEIFSVQDPQSAITLFGSEYLALGLIASVLLLLGFSAFGPALIYLVMMLYGLGSGTLLLCGCSDLSPSKAFFFFVLSAFPAAVSEGWLCIFASASLQASNSLKKYAFSKSPCTMPNLRNAQSTVVLGYYVLTVFLMLPICGISTGLAYLSSLF